MHFILMMFSFLITLFFSLYAILGIEIKLNSNLKTCIEKTNSWERSHKNLTQSLLNLNSRAYMLRLNRQAAEAGVKSAPPPAKPAAVAHLNFVKFLQFSFVQYQNTFFVRAQIEAIKKQQELIFEGFFPKKSSFTLHVESYPKNSDSPSYRLKQDFEELNKVLFTKRLDLIAGFPTPLKRLLKKSALLHTINCGGIITKKGEEELSDIKLILDKF